MSDQKDVVEILAAAIDESFIGLAEGGTRAFAKARAEFVIKALEDEGYTITRRSGVRHEQEEYVAR